MIRFGRTYVIDFKKLNSVDWHDVIDELYLLAKPEMHGPNGYIRTMKELNEPARKQAIEGYLDSFKGLKSTAGLDAKVNALGDRMKKINHKASQNLYYDYATIFEAETNLIRFPTLSLIQGFMRTAQHQKKSINRLKGLLGRLTFESLSQANKSNAGEAGENIVKAILRAAGLKENVHYRTQYKSKTGSDTDFVFPYVEDGQDSKVEALLAVQMSTNDRARLTHSELKTGGIPFMFTGNGMNASSKKLRAIGHQIILEKRSQNVRIVCIKDELNFEKDRLKKLINEGKATAEIHGRLAYFNEFGFTMESFADYLRERFSAKKYNV